MSALEALFAASAAQHRHLCPRQVLGVRMGVLAGGVLGLILPQQDKRLITLIETDGCFADGISSATGCCIGHRTLRVMDYGKVAATFVDARANRAVRIAPRSGARDRAAVYAPGQPSHWHTQLVGYQCMPDAELLSVQPVTLTFKLEQWVSRPGHRVTCDVCGEEVINEREVLRNGLTLCRTCAGERYYEITPQ